MKWRPEDLTIDSIARTISEFEAQRRRASMRLVDPDPEVEQRKRFIAELSKALSKGEAEVQVCSWIEAGSIFLLKSATGHRLLFHSESDRDTFLDGMGWRFCGPLAVEARDDAMPYEDDYRDVQGPIHRRRVTGDEDLTRASVDGFCPLCCARLSWNRTFCFADERETECAQCRVVWLAPEVRS